MNEKLQKLEVRRLEIAKSHKNNILLGFLFLIPSVTSIFYGATKELTVLMIIGIIFIVLAIIFFGKAAGQSSKYRNIIKTELIQLLLEDQFENVTYNPKAYIDVSKINATGTVRKPDRHQGEDYIKGSYKGITFEVSDINLKQRVEHVDKNGHVRVTYETYFKGRWFIYRFTKQLDQVLKIVEGRGSQVNKRNLEKFDTESIEFNKKFDIFSSTKEFGFYLITPSMIEKLLELEKLHRGSILYCFMNNELHIGVNDGKDYMELKLKTPINEKTIGLFTADIELIPAIVNEFRLDSNKFK